MNTLQLYSAILLFSCGGVLLFPRVAIAQQTQPNAGETQSAKAALAFRAVQAKCAQVREAAEAVKLWQDFLARNPDGEPSQKAQEQLRLWQARAADGSRLMGKDWWSPAKLRAALAEAQPDLAAARAYWLQLAVKPDPATEGAARKALAAALEKFPHHRDAFFLRGLINMLTRQNAAAAVDFQKSVELDAAFWPGSVNRAVALSRSRNFSAAVLACRQAALAGPTAGPFADLILDNFDEALNLLDPNEAKLSYVQQAAQLFKGRLDVRILEQQQHDLVRWGSSWLPRAEYQAVQDQIAKINAALEGPQARRQWALQRIADANSQLKQNGVELEAIDTLLRGAGASSATLTANIVNRRSLLFEQRDDYFRQITEGKESLVLAEREIADLEKTRPRPPYKQALAAVDQSLLDVLPPPFGLFAASHPSASVLASQPAAILPWMIDSPLPPR